MLLKQTKKSSVRKNRNPLGSRFLFFTYPFCVSVTRSHENGEREKQGLHLSTSRKQAPIVRTIQRKTKAYGPTDFTFLHCGNRHLSFGQYSEKQYPTDFTYLHQGNRHLGTYRSDNTAKTTAYGPTDFTYLQR